MRNKLSINFKTITSYALALLVVISSFGFASAVNAGAVTPTVTIGSQSALNGAAINVPISAPNFTDVGSIDFGVQYDTSLLTYTGYATTPLSGTFDSDSINLVGNTINISWPSQSVSLSNGEILTLKFTVISATTTNASLTVVGAKEMGNVAGNVIASSFVNGAITLNPASTIATITSGTYTVSAGGTASETINNVPFGTSKATFLATLAKGEVHQTWNDAGIDNPVVTGNTLVVTAQDGLTTVAYTVAVNTNPDIALVAADKAALVDDSIKGANIDLSNITIALTNPLPSLGDNGSTITWVSSSPTVVSNDGQTINRPAFASGNAVVTLTATLTKGIVTDTKSFSLTVLKLPASTVATITSTTYTVGADTITNIPFGTSKATFLTALIKGESNQIWNDAGISDPVVTGNTLVVTAQNGLTIATYTVTVELGMPTITWSNPADIVYGTALSGTQLNATASIDGVFAYAPDFGAVLKVGAAQTLSVTFTPTDIVDYTTATKTVSIKVTPVTLTISGVTANDKTYNGTTLATIDASEASLVGVISPDSISVDSSGTVGTFDNKNVGNGKTVTVSGLTLSGANAGNYTLTQPTTTANITAKSLTVSATAGSSKIYDGGTSADQVALTADAFSDDVVIPTGIPYYFIDRNVGTGKPVEVKGISISGAGAGNYNLSNTTAKTTADITQKDLTVSATSTNKVYDSTTDTNSGEVIFSTDAIDGDVVTPNYTSATFDGPDVGAHSVSISGISISGTDAGNYNLLNTTATATANITEQSATVTFDSGDNFNQTYTGSQISPITVTAVPAVSTSVTYNGSTDIPVNAGTYTVIGFVTDANYAGQTDSQILTVNKIDQTITFNPLDGKNSSDSDFSISATATSGLGISFSTSGQCTVSEGIVYITGAGSCTITASQIGNINYNPASDVLQSFTITDNTPPAISGLSNNPTPTKSKTWTWSSDDETATYRFVVDQNLDGVPTGDYSDVKTATQASGDGTYYLHVQAKDTLGNESTITTVSAVLDNTVPVLTLPADVTTSTTSSSGKAVNFTAPTATDVIDGSVTVTCNYNSGDNFPIGTTIITCGAVDKAGNAATGTFNVILTLTSTGGGGGGGGGGGNPPIIPPVIQTTIKAGDANGDNKVDKYDFALMMANWGKTGTNVCDFNGDGKVDKYDFALLMSKWGL